jgi:methylmalonyl-CoA mutase, N-terminal domain
VKKKNTHDLSQAERRFAEKLGPEGSRPRQTLAGIELPPIELPVDRDYLESQNFPGFYPFTRGIQPTMYRGRLWTMRQYSGFGTASETNKRYRFLLSQGTTGLSVAFDLPTQMGRDSDDPRALGEVGRVGVAIDTIEDMAELFDGIPLEDVSVSVTINATAHILLALYLALARRRSVPWTKLRGTVQNDILKEYIARGTYIYPPKPALRIVTDIFEFCSEHVPEWNTISISGYHIREAGSTAVHELAFTFADAIAYIEFALARGLKLEAFAPRLAFFFNCHNGFLEEVAKFRAARRLWAKIMRERFGAADDRSCMLRFHTQTAGSSLTAQQPMVNVVRTTLQALAAVFGGTQSLHTNAFDEALCLPTDESALLALRTQQVIAFESGVADIVDPFAGSYAVERLTDEIERRSTEYIEKIDAMGGMLKAIESGYPQEEIESSAYDYQKKVDTGELKIVGVNVCKEDSRINVPLLKIDPALEQQQVEKLRQIKAKRDNGKVGKHLEEIARRASGSENLLPALVAAVDDYVTLGEISEVLREKFGTYGTT